MGESMRVALLCNNGVRVKLAPPQAHRYLKEDWARIPDDDETSRKVYTDWLKGVPAPNSELPDGYEIRQNGQWHSLYGPDGEKVGSASRDRGELVGRA